jgi:hypothetical protein
MVGENFDSRKFAIEAKTDSASEADARKYLGVNFACCGVYARVYVNSEQTHYVGHCPKCARRVEFKIGRGGTDQRFFTAY